MTKPIPTGCIKEHPSPSWKKFNLLIESVTLDDKIGHLFVVDIKFDKKNATEREILHNKILPRVIEKQKILDANKRLIFQLLYQYQKTEKGAHKAYCCTKKFTCNINSKKIYTTLSRRFVVFNYPLFMTRSKALFSLYLWIKRL